MAEPRRFHCIGCRKNVLATTDDHYRKHDRVKGEECARSKRDIPTWLLRRGPESGPETDTPVKGRDYADCPQCDASPVLDGATGHFTDHTREGETPTSPRVPCPGSGQPYESGESECEDTKASELDAAPATSEAEDRADSGPTEAEEMISKWAATAREIEDRKLPPSPESTTTPQDSPPRPNAPEAPPAVTPSGDASSATPSSGGQSIPQRPCHIAKDHGPHKWMHERRQAQCPGKPAPSSTSERGVAAVMRLSRKSAPTPPATPADSAAPAVADAPERSPAPAPPPDAALTPTASGRTEPAAAAPAEPLFAQPGSPFSQPAKPPAAAGAVPMSLHGEQIAARLKEMFYSYTNQMERSVQATMGPSEIGSPCDRRIALSLLRVVPVNPGGDNWASFVGTCVHTGLADMFMWADRNQGRFAVEVPLTFPSPHVPRGTADLLDRTLVMVMDHKALGRWSLNKLKSEGPSPTYRVQVHTYAFGMRLKGEAVDHVALVAWPREASSLDDLYVWTEPYDPAIARDALARVDRIAAEIETRRDALNRQHVQPLEVARQFTVADDCVWCPFHAPGDPNMTRGCPGRA